MKILFRSLTAIATVGIAPLACEVHDPELDSVQQFCAQAGWVFDDDGVNIGNRYEFRAIGTDPDTYGLCSPHEPPPTMIFEENLNNPDLDQSTLTACSQPIPDRMISPPAGSFEGDFWVKPGTLIIDDDDLTDDLPGYQNALKVWRDLLTDDDGEPLPFVETYKNLTEDQVMEGVTEEEQAALDAVIDAVLQMEDLCPRFDENRATGVAPRPGDDLLDGTFPSFTACKDHYEDSGDGIVGTFELTREGGADQDELLASCPTVGGGSNRNALNIWGPLTVQENAIEELLPDVVDGHTFSGITVPMETSGWKWTIDRSHWEGVSFWARLATAEEALPTTTLTPGREREPLAGAPIPEGARPQDGVGQVGIIIQTIDTGAVLNERGEMDFMDPIGVCDEGQSSETHFCFDTQAEFDAFPGMVREDDPTMKWAYHSEVGDSLDPSVPYEGLVPASFAAEGPCVDYSPVDIVVGEEPSYRDHCWDGFRTMVDVTPEWRHYFLPFSEMRQAGWGRVGDSFRLDQLRSVNILTSAYQPVNVMIDELAFYRAR